MRSLLILLFTMTSLAPAFAQEEEEKQLGWSNVADLSFVVTSGNSSNSTLALDDKLGYVWENADFSGRFGALRTKTTDDRFAVGTPDDFDVIEDDTRELDNERYYVSGQYRRNLSSRVYWLAGAGWDRDKDQGIDNRTTLFAGVGNTWVDRETTKFTTDYALTFTRRIDEIEDPERNERFSEARLSWDYMQKLNADNQIDSEFTFFARPGKLSDNRFNTINSLTSSLNKMFALRFSVQFIYQNIPALEDIDLFDPVGLETGTVVVRKDKLDTILKFSFVVTL